MCLNANIQRQFEFINHTWLNNPKFDRLYDDADPITAPSAPFGGTFTIPTDGVRERVTNVPRFVSVKGGAYFFLPGLAALRYLIVDEVIRRQRVVCHGSERVSPSVRLS